MSAMMLDEEELKARQTEKVGNDLSRPSIGGNEQVRFVAELAKKIKEYFYRKYDEEWHFCDVFEKKIIFNNTGQGDG